MESKRLERYTLLDGQDTSVVKSTILYISSNVQNPNFEAKIMDNLIKNAKNKPIVWVTQEPLNKPGVNICVGRHASSYFNEFRQIEIGLNAIETPYVTMAEADCLYPPEYFIFDPPELGHRYLYENSWIQDLYPRRDSKFRYKGVSDFAQVVDRKLWLEHLRQYLPKDPEWSDENSLPYLQLHHFPDPTFTGRPAISFKTEGSLSKKTPLKHNVPRRTSLELWGSALKLKEKMLSSL